MLEVVDLYPLGDAYVEGVSWRLLFKFGGIEDLYEGPVQELVAENLTGKTKVVAYVLQGGRMVDVFAPEFIPEMRAAGYVTGRIKHQKRTGAKRLTTSRVFRAEYSAATITHEEAVRAQYRDQLQGSEPPTPEVIEQWAGKFAHCFYIPGIISDIKELIELEGGYTYESFAQAAWDNDVDSVIWDQYGGEMNRFDTDAAIAELIAYVDTTWPYVTVADLAGMEEFEQIMEKHRL